MTCGGGHPTVNVAARHCYELNQDEDDWAWSPGPVGLRFQPRSRLDAIVAAIVDAMPDEIIDPPRPPGTRAEIEASIRANEPELTDAEVEAAVDEVLAIQDEEEALRAGA